ncbi:CHAT domain-containing protein [Sphaerotilus sp.]|uniref:CHAT domain-containing protein n=1 Tax=Sphaerotilus sp. TaxID=2093942 RepID=UPI002ACDC7D6|nr:CHAT domain-containing protein [Sphaerotilus sp.]MDZ7854977.1 tetratricopeptide repeat protein [Sphaerotilus sp.]
MPGKLFISHSTQDDDLVRRLRRALADLGQDGWIDSRELRGGDPLWPEVEAAIGASAGLAVIVSINGLQSEWVGEEVAHALKLQAERGRDKFPVVPLAVDGCKLGVLEKLFPSKPLYIPISSAAGGIDAALHAILVALRKRDPSDPPPTVQPPAAPMEELVLELSRLSIHEADGKRRARGSARLVYEPADRDKREVRSPKSWTFEAPLGPIEVEELRWYLETYAVWPSRFDEERVKRIEANLVEWGRALHHAAMPADKAASVLQAWAQVGDGAARRFSVHVEPELDDGTPEADALAAREAATLLLGLPWELLHDGRGFLFQGGRPVRVRRRLPNTHAVEPPVLATPIRILLASPRPEDEACGYIDHRASSLPLVRAMEELGEVVHLTLLATPTLSALQQELQRAKAVGQSYHVLHFDGHGVYDRRVGLGGLCFEHDEDGEKLDERRHRTVYTDTLGPLLRDHGIALVFLEACQSAQAEQASESVASEMLKTGVASVVAMSHSVLVETSRRFVTAFYGALAKGARVGDAMLVGQSELETNPCRGRIFGEDDLKLRDWFVPVLFQDKADPQLFKETPTKQTAEDRRTRINGRLHATPPEPATGFIGRSRELLRLERVLQRQRYAVLRGQGGEGKTALAAEFARWRVRSRQVRRAAFVSVEQHSHDRAVLDVLGRQLVGQDYSVATFATLDDACRPVERVLREDSVLLVVDNLESVLPAPPLPGAVPDPLADLNADAADAILQLCARLGIIGDTRLVFTSREALPAPFDAPQARIELHRLSAEDAIRLVERALETDVNASPSTGPTPRNASAADIRDLVDAVHGHARTLALLAPSLRHDGVSATRTRLVELMAQMERDHPGEREKSLYASVELSLQRLPPEMQEQAKVLAVFHGGVQLDVPRTMMGWKADDVGSLASGLVSTGLATPDPYGHLTLNPALCPYLHARASAEQLADWQARWLAVMLQYVELLQQQYHQDTLLAATLIQLELPNLMALLTEVERAGQAEATIDLCTSLHRLLQGLGRPRLLHRVAAVRDTAQAALGEGWSHARFQAEQTRIEQLLDQGRMQAAFDGAQALRQRAQSAGEAAYQGADYDWATACFLLGRILNFAGAAGAALPLLEEARQRFENVATARPNRSAEGMASASITEAGDCLRNLGRLDEAAAAYGRAIQLDEARQAHRGAAVGKGQLGTVRLMQRHYTDALAVYEDARQTFESLGEPGSVATIWHQIGMVQQAAGQPQSAEEAYRHSLSIEVQRGNEAGQAMTLCQLGNLYDELGRFEEAAAFYLQAADRFKDDRANEGRTRNNLASTLSKLGRLDEARQEIERAIVCEQGLGHAAELWKTWAILSDIETDAGRLPEAQQARLQATEAYRAYRRDGGENLVLRQRSTVAPQVPSSSRMRGSTPAKDGHVPAWVPAFAGMTVMCSRRLSVKSAVTRH